MGVDLMRRRAEDIGKSKANGATLSLNDLEIKIRCPDSWVMNDVFTRLVEFGNAGPMQFVDYRGIPREG